MNRPEGYRYIRQYWRGQDRENYALYEVKNGKARRVGTARSEAEYRKFLFSPAVSASRLVAQAS